MQEGWGVQVLNGQYSGICRGLDMGQMSNLSLTWKKNDDDDI